MTRYFRVIITIFFLLTPFLAVFPATVVDLNQATITVSDRSSEVLNTALKSAFAQVLIKMSGNPAVMTLPTIQNALPDLQQWVQSYSYVTPQLEGQAGQSSSSKLQLQVAFDRHGVSQLLQEAGQPIWSADRPLTLICVDGDQEQWQPVIKQFANDYGVPVVFAAMDLSDQAMIDSPDAVSQLETRYEVSSVLMVHPEAPMGKMLQLQGKYTINGNVTQWMATGLDQKQAAQDMVGKLMNSMMGQLGSNDNAALKSVVNLSVMGVKDIADYAKVTNYLRHREDVVDVSVKDITGSGVVFEVHITGDVSRFQQILAGDHRLKAVDNALAQNAHGADLYYYW